jgi:hypothetical protein
MSASPVLLAFLIPLGESAEQRGEATWGIRAEWGGKMLNPKYLGGDWLFDDDWGGVKVIDHEACKPVSVFNLAGR